MRKNLKNFSLILSLIFCLAGFSFAQETTGTIEGVATDSAGAVVPNVTVSIEGINRGFNRTTTTGSDGFYRLQQVPPGTYKITTTATNFQTFTNDQVSVVLGSTSKVDVKLLLQGVEAQVNVVANGEAIDLTGSKVQTSITGRSLELLPKGVSFASVLKAAAPVRPEPAAAGFQIDGASGSENTFIIDGQEVTNFRTGNLNSTNNISLDFVQEVQVKTSGFEAEYGGATGGVINVVTRGGGNDLRGSVGVQFTPSKLQAGPRPINFGDPTTLTYIQPNRDFGTDFFPTANLSGPIIKQKLWFLVNYSPQFFHTQRRNTFSDGETREFRTDTRQEYAFARIDAAPTNNLSLTSSFTYNPLTQNGVVPSFGTLFANNDSSPANRPNIADQQNLGGRIPASIFNVGGTYIFGKNFFVSSRYGRSYLNEKLSNYGIPSGVTRYRCLGQGNPLCPLGFNNPSSSTFRTEKDISIRQTFDADASVSVPNLGGRHQFKGGIQINDISNDVNEGYVDTGEIRLFYGSSTADRNGVTVGKRPGEIGVGYLQTFGTIGQAGSRNTALYLQDKYQPFTRLTFNLGVRIERENVPTFSANGQSINFNFGDKIAPRIGFAYDVGGNGKFKIFASYGRFYDRFKYELPRGSFGGDLFLRDYFVILASNPSPTFYTRSYALNPANNVKRLDFRVPSNSTNDFRVEPNLKAQQQTEFTGGIQYQLLKNMVVGARYIHKQIDHAIEDIGYHIATTIPGTTQTQGSEAYYIGNPGEGICKVGGCGAYGPGYTQAIPKPERKYDALEITASKRFSGNYSFDSSYTYSRLFGNYPGLASSDEFIVNGSARNSPNVNRLFDQPFVGYSVGGAPDNGLLPTDRPHVFKFSGSYSYNWSKLFGRELGKSNNTTDFSTFFVAQSGTPLTTRVDLLDVTTIPLYGRGDLGRTPIYTQTDFYVQHTYRFGRDNRYSIVGEFNVLNAFNQAIVLARQESLTTQLDFTPGDFGIAGTAADPTGRITFDRLFFNGTTVTAAKILAIANEAGNGDVNFNQPLLFQAPRSIRFGFRFVF